MALNKNIRFGFTDVTLNEFSDFKEEVEILKVRFYKGKASKRNFVRFTMKANKLQEERISTYIYENTSFDWVKPKEDI